MAPAPRRPTRHELLEAFRGDLSARLPSTWSVDVQLQEGGSRGSSIRPIPDATLTVRDPNGREATIPVEIKDRIEPKDVASVDVQVKAMIGPAPDAGALVLAPYLSPRTRELLATGGTSYATSTGMFHVVVSSPPPDGLSFYLHEESAHDRNPWTVPREQPLRTLRGPVAGRVVRALCDYRPPYGVQELAERSDTPIASVSRVIALLEAEALITRASEYRKGGLVTRVSRGSVEDVKWEDLIRRWVQDYAFSKANTVQTYLEPRGLLALLDKLRQTGVRYAVTGSQAASTLAPVTAPRLLSIYVDNLNDAANELKLRPAERGANVVLAEPFNPVVFERTLQVNGIRYAAPSQVAADLLTGPGRSPAEADALLGWMKANENAWRA